MNINNALPDCPVHHTVMQRRTQWLDVGGKPILVPYYFCPEEKCPQAWSAIRGHYLLPADGVASDRRSVTAPENASQTPPPAS